MLPFNLAWSGKVPVPPVNPNTSLLVHFDTNFQPAVGNTPTVSNSGISTTIWKFGGGSSVYTGGDSYADYPLGTGAAYGTGDFTWEFWYYTDNNSSNKYLIDHGGGNGGTIACPGTVLRYYNGTVGVVNFSGNITLGQWGFVAVARQSGITRLFYNGVLSGTVSDSHNYTSTVPVRVGNFGAGATLPALGYIDELRITKGQALYTASFVPPTAPFTD